MLKVVNLKMKNGGFRVVLFDEADDSKHQVDISIHKDTLEIKADNYKRNGVAMAHNADDTAIDAVASAVCFLEMYGYIKQDEYTQEWNYVDYDELLQKELTEVNLSLRSDI